MSSDQIKKRNGWGRFAIPVLMCACVALFAPASAAAKPASPNKVTKIILSLLRDQYNTSGFASPHEMRLKKILVSKSVIRLSGTCNRKDPYSTPIKSYTETEFALKTATCIHRRGVPSKYQYKHPSIDYGSRINWLGNKVAATAGVKASQHGPTSRISVRRSKAVLSFDEVTTADGAISGLRTLTLLPNRQARLLWFEDPNQARKGVQLRGLSEHTLRAASTPVASTASSCAKRATHPSAGSLSSAFIVKGHRDDIWVKTNATMRGLTGCSGEYVWKVRIRKENRGGYYNGSKVITIGRGTAAQTLTKVVRTHGDLACDGSVHPQDGIYDAYQLNWFVYNNAGHKTVRRVRSAVAPLWRYC